MTIENKKTVISTQDFEKKVEMECMFIMRETGQKKESAYTRAKAIVAEKFTC